MTVIPEHPFALPLTPPETDKCLPTLFLDPSGAVVESPWALLGLDQGTADATAIQDAFRTQLLAYPPERHPNRARAIREARDLLLAADGFYDAHIGKLHVPDPDAWGLPTVAPDSPPPPALTMEDRLLGQGALYALVEASLWDDEMQQYLVDWIRVHLPDDVADQTDVP